MDPALTYTVPSGWYNKFDHAAGYGLECRPERPRWKSSATSWSPGPTAWKRPNRASARRRRRWSRRSRPVPASTRPSRPRSPSAACPASRSTSRSRRTGLQPCPFSEGRPIVPTVMDPQALAGTGLHWDAERVTDGSFTRYIILDLPAGGTLLISPGGSPSFVTEAMPVIQSSSSRLGDRNQVTWPCTPRGASPRGSRASPVRVRWLRTGP